MENFAEKVTADCVSQGLCDDHVARSSGKVEGVTSTLTSEQQQLKSYLAQLMQVRSQHPALYAGERRNLWIDDQLYVDLKVYQDEQVVYALNTSNVEQSLPLDNTKLKTATRLVDLMTGESIPLQLPTTNVSVPALTGRLLLVE